jgi:hypothetical protein
VAEAREFARHLELIAEAVRRNTLITVKRAAIAADQTAVMKTPVDTGRARANWLVSVGVAEYTVTEAAKKLSKGAATNAALEQGRDAILSYKLGQGGIFITNSVAYIGFLDAGSSAQAPKGMTAAAIQAAARQLGSAKLLR